MWQKWWHVKIDVLVLLIPILTLRRSLSILCCTCWPFPSLSCFPLQLEFSTGSNHTSYCRKNFQLVFKNQKSWTAAGVWFPPKPFVGLPQNSRLLSASPDKLLRWETTTRSYTQLLSTTWSVKRWGYTWLAPMSTSSSLSWIEQKCSQMQIWLLGEFLNRVCLALC